MFAFQLADAQHKSSIASAHYIQDLCILATLLEGHYMKKDYEGILHQHWVGVSTLTCLRSFVDIFPSLSASYTLKMTGREKRLLESPNTEYI